MKKRILLLVGVAILILAMASISFAQGGYHRGNRNGVAYGDGYGYGHMWNADLTEEELEALHDERMEAHKDSIAGYLEDGKITQEQHDNWIQHIDDMDEFREENGFGFGPSYGGFGGCHGGRGLTTQ